MDKHFRVMGRKKFYETVDEIQADLEAYLMTYNRDRPHQGRGLNERTPYRAFTDGLPKSDKAKKMEKTETRKAA